MSLVTYVLKRPYTVVALLILICLLGIGAALRMPVDIFPEIDIPVFSVVWTYNGMSAEDIQNRILTLHERQLASLVDDIARIEATSYNGVGVEKVYLHEGADVTPRRRAAREQRAGGAEVHAAEHHAAAGAALRRDRRADHPAQPVEQLAARHQAQRPRAEHHPPGLAVVHGAEVPYPYGGKPRVIMADLDPAGAAGARAVAGRRQQGAAARRTSSCRPAT